MVTLKRLLFSTFINLQPFFNLAFPLMFGLSVLGTTLGIILMVTPSNVHDSSQLICLGFVLTGVYLMLLKKHYAFILAWADTRESQVIPLRTDNSRYL